MRRILFSNGGQPWYNNDFKVMHDELYAAIEQQFVGNGSFVLSGCNVSGNSISAGLVFIGGNVNRVMRLPAATGLTFPAYIKAAPPVNQEQRLFVEDNTLKFVKQLVQAEIVTDPTGINASERITIAENVPIRSWAEVLYATPKSAVRLTKNTTQSFNGFSTPLVFGMKDIDVLNEYNTTTGAFRPKISGLYSVSVNLRTSISSYTSGDLLGVYFGNFSNKVAEVFFHAAAPRQQSLSGTLLVNLIANTDYFFAGANENAEVIGGVISTASIVRIS